jgi:hypothetical protein
MRRLAKVSSLSFCLIFFFGSLLFPQSKETGAIQGTVHTLEGEPLPGVEVTISSPGLIGGAKSAVTNAEGRYRFPALPVGKYEAEAKLQGFNPEKKVDIRLSVQMTLTVDFVLSVGTLQESAEVIAAAPIIDVKDSQLSTTTMEKEFLTQLPSSRTIRDQITYAPSSVGERGATPYGASESLSNSFLIDGVKTNSPEAGEPEVALDYDSVEEMKTMGQGTNAEYDGFSGIVVSTIMKSGGNALQALGSFWFQLPGFHSANWGAYVDTEGNPYLYNRSWDANYDYHVNVGGPFIKDKLWWYASAKYNRNHQNIEDYQYPTEINNRTRALGKLTWQIGPSDRIFGTFDYLWRSDKNIEAGPLVAPEAVGKEKGWQSYFNSNYLHIFSPTTFLEAKIGGYRQSFKNDIPYDIPAHVDAATEERWGNFIEIWEGTRKRTELVATVSNHAERFLGTHDFKFGVEFENSYMRNYRGYPGGKMYIDYNHEPYLMYTYSPYEIQPTTKRYSGFVQDQWAVSDRITVNWGIRWNRWRGSTPAGGTIFKPKDGWAPRVGITFDLLGDHTTALKLHYGKYYHGVMGMWYGHWSEKGAFTAYQWNGQDYEMLFEDTWDIAYRIDPNLKFPYVNNFVVGLERELGKEIVVGVSGIYRTHKNLMDAVNLTGEWVPVPYTDPYGLGTHTIYERLNPGDNDKYITNPYKGQGSDIGAAFPDIVPFTPSRKYAGIEFSIRKRFSNKWQFYAAYTYSRAWGSDDNSWGEYQENRTSSLGSSVLFLNPNWSINAEGTLTRDHPHILKLMGSYVLPLQITLGFYYSFTSSPTYNHNILVPEEIDPDSVGLYSGRLHFYGEKKGSFRYPAQHRLDIRLEKSFTFANSMKFGLLMDMFNVLNASTVTEYETALEPSAYPFRYVWGIVAPRTFRFGVNFEF